MANYNEKKKRDEQADLQWIPVPNVPNHFHDNVNASKREMMNGHQRQQRSFSSHDYPDQGPEQHLRSLPKKESFRRRETIVVMKYSEADQKSPSTPLLFSQSPESEE